MKKYNKKGLKLNVDLAGNKSGSIIDIEVDKDGTPTERYWRDRLKDAPIDGCVEWANDPEVTSGEKSKKQAAKKKPGKSSGAKT